MTNENRPLESQDPARTRAPHGGGLKFLGVTPLRPCPYLPGRLERSIVTPLAGAMIPTVLHRLGVDPAVASSVFVHTLTDLVGFVMVLNLAAALLF